MVAKTKEKTKKQNKHTNQTGIESLIIESLTKVSTAKNANLKEFIKETGVMRICFAT
jgi:hypothetical protein